MKHCDVSFIKACELVYSFVEVKILAEFSSLKVLSKEPEK